MNVLLDENEIMWEVSKRNNNATINAELDNLQVSIIIGLDFQPCRAFVSFVNSRKIGRILIVE